MKSGTIYRLQYNIADFNLVITPPPLAQAMKDYFPEIETIGRLYGRTASVSVEGGPDGEGKRFEEERLFLLIVLSMTFSLLK